MRKNITKIIAIFMLICICIGVVPVETLALSKSSDDLKGARVVEQKHFSKENTYKNERIDKSSVPEIIGYENAISKNHKERMYDKEKSLNEFVFMNDDGKAINRGVVIVTATHKVTNRVYKFEVYVKNSELSSSDKTSIYNEFDELIGSGYANLPLYNILDVEAALEDVLQNDATITKFSNEYRIPKEFVQSVLFREIWCYSLGDATSDTMVRDYYQWKLGNKSEPLIKKTDSSTGLGQIFAKTAINALNNANDRGFISLSAKYDKNNWRHMWTIWSNLHDDDSFNIQCCALVILDCQYEYEEEVPYDDFFDYSEEQIKMILARYNGYGEAAEEYADICYEYYEIFEKYN